VFPTRLTRRSLFTIPQPAYVAVPGIDPLTCVSADGCTVCVGACPQNAYEWIQGKIAFDKDACQPCGQCLTACPAGAIANPVTTPAAIAAQIEAMVAASREPLAVAFRCATAKAGPVGVGWHAVDVTCTGMVTAPWALAPLVLGAAQVAVLPCSTNGCDRNLDGAAKEAVDYATDLLTALGIAGSRVTLTPTAVLRSALPVTPVDDPFGSRAAPRVYQALRTVSKSPVSEVRGPAANVGVVGINPTTCTMCTMCAQVCPSGALQANYPEPGVLGISFDPGSCTACKQCVAVCPEAHRGAIAVEPGVDFTALDVGRVELNRSATFMCERCGQPVAPEATMDRIANLLGNPTGLMGLLTRRCLACRGVS
jgi:NAD-dependent dihydropyrimidine dehydrogenase PreA subunit